MSRTLFISDLGYLECQGGAESNDKVILERLDCDFIKSCFFSDPSDYDRVIVSNHYQLSEEGKQALIEHGNYAVIHHDYLLFESRLPPSGDIAPPEALQNVEFYKKAKTIIFQTEFQKAIFDKNIHLPQGIVLNGNLWNDNHLNRFALAPSYKNGRIFIMQGNYASKGTEQAVAIANQLRLPYDIHPSMPYEDFIDLLGTYSGVILWPMIPESFGRVSMEAKMSNVLVLTNELMAASHSSFYNLSRMKIIRHMMDRREWLIDHLKNF